MSKKFISFCSANLEIIEVKVWSNKSWHQIHGYVTHFFWVKICYLPACFACRGIKRSFFRKSPFSSRDEVLGGDMSRNGLSFPLEVETFEDNWSSDFSSTFPADILLGPSLNPFVPLVVVVSKAAGVVLHFDAEKLLISSPFLSSVCKSKSPLKPWVSQPWSWLCCACKKQKNKVLNISSF